MKVRGAEQSETREARVDRECEWKSSRCVAIAIGSSIHFCRKFRFRLERNTRALGCRFARQVHC